tara:strand:+ start:584 stop:865 length:282 start_codon:yes stop_codon:yes gene_type:complete
MERFRSSEILDVLDLIFSSRDAFKAPVVLDDSESTEETLRAFRRDLADVIIGEQVTSVREEGYSYAAGGTATNRVSRDYLLKALSSSQMLPVR